MLDVLLKLLKIQRSGRGSKKTFCMSISIYIASVIDIRQQEIEFETVTVTPFFLGTTAQLTHRFCACFLLTQYPHFPNYNIGYERSQEY